MDITIITNNKYRDFIYGHELTDKEKKDFNYIEDIDSHDFFRYRGHVYDPCEFMRVENNESLKDWHGYSSDSYFSGVLVKYSEDCEQIKVGRFYS